jgi:small GTP-binding protein
MSQTTSPASKQFKVVFVGDGQVGKTSIIRQKCFGTSKSDSDNNVYLPNIEDRQILKIFTNGIENDVEIVDIGGSAEFFKLTSLSYENTDYFVICFAIDDENSFQNVKENWITEVGKFAPNAKKILIGTKGDLRTNEVAIEKMNEKNLKFVDEKDALEMHKFIDAFAYLETSAWMHMNIDEIFDTIIKKHNEKTKPEKQETKNCIIM